MSVKQNSPPPLSLFLMDKINMEIIPIKIKWKIHAPFTLYFKLWSYFLQKNLRCNHQIFYFLLFLLAFTSADVIFHNFLELHSTLTEKKIFVTNFPILTDSLNPPPPPRKPLNRQNPLSVTKVFWRCSLTWNTY